MKRLLVFYSHFYPAFKAGGPVQSLANLVDLLHKEYRIYVVCSAYEMGETAPLKDVVLNEWTDYHGKAKVYYISRSPFRAIWNAFRQVGPDVAYLNGIFLFLYTVVPIIFAKLNHIGIVLAPRGMLQQGALTVKPFKKKVFLHLFKFLSLHCGIQWHATDTQELNDIRKWFGSGSDIKVVGNVAKQGRCEVVKREKLPGSLRMVFLSVISQKKNLDLVLKSLMHVDIPLQFDIYGPIKDRGYWLECEGLIKGQKHTIRYLGAVDPSRVQHILSQYHVFVLPTKGENFGHAIYEAFSVGTPAIISEFTPWGALERNNSGVTVNLEDASSLTKAILRFVSMDAEELNAMSLKAHELALTYDEPEKLRNSYKLMLDFKK